MGIEISVESDEGVMSSYSLDKGNRATMAAPGGGILQVYSNGEILTTRGKETKITRLEEGQSWTIDANRGRVCLEIIGKKGYVMFDEMNIRGENWSIVIRREI